MQRMLAATMLTALLLLAACGSEDDGGPPANDDPPHWSYDGEHGPDHWGELFGFMDCANGMIESPVALESGLEPADLPDLELDYDISQVAILNSGHSVQYDYDPGSHLRVGGKSYELLQFHFHAPSEHTLDGREYPMEVHLVHRSEEGELAVLGAFIEEGEAHEMLVDAAWASLPATADERHVDADAMFNAAELVPGGNSYRYVGSLTTPPCTEGIAWHVFDTPITLSSEQIEAFTALYSNNARPAQDVPAHMLAYGD